MLKAHEELWSMPLDTMVETLIGFKDGAKRDKTRLVTFKCPFNAAVQVYDYKRKQSRVCFGPDLVKLEPDEQFTVINLSGSKPKRPNVIKTLHVSLGPDFFSDIFQVETSDHARLQLQLSYNWHFIYNRDSQESANKIFNVKDFVGDACSAIASKVRGEVAALNFEAFHKHSARYIRKAIFGLDKDGKVIDNLIFHNNDLYVTNVDIQIVEPVDEKTKQSLQKLVTLAIEITTRMQEAEAKKEAD
jgi:major vault protein